MLGLIIWLSIVSVICIVETVLIVILLSKQKKQEDNHFIDLKFCDLESSIQKAEEKIDDLNSAISILSTRKK